MYSQSKVIGSSGDNERKRKDFRSCNCKRSNCLKLYCECFANAFYCIPGKCNCHNCQNNRENESHRKAAVEYTLERNPMAFRSKIVGNDTTAKDAASRVQSHHKGCHCKKSNCLKKYCECFQANIVCTERCRCTECKNFTGSEFRSKAIQKLKEVNAEFMESAMSADTKNMDPVSLAEYYSAQTAALYDKLADKMSDALQPQPADAMLSISQASIGSCSPVRSIKRLRIAKEFSQCLDAILDQTEFLYSVGNASYSNYEAAFTAPTAAVAEPSNAPLISRRPKYMEPLQSISAANAMLPPAPMPAENLIRSVPPLPHIPQAVLGSFHYPSADSFQLTPIVTSSPDKPDEHSK